MLAVYHEKMVSSARRIGGAEMRLLLSAAVQAAFALCVCPDMPMKLIFAGLSLLLLPICGRSADAEKAKTEPQVHSASVVLNAPDGTGDGWDTCTPAEVGLNSAVLGDMLQKIVSGSYKNIHGVLLVKDGKLVVEEYFAGTNGDGKEQVFKRASLHTLQSITKSVNSILVGIAIDQHLISNVDQKISSFFPDEADLFKDEEKNAITLKHCLSMSTGLEWTESGVPYTDPRNDAYGLNRSKDKSPVRYVFERPVAIPAGERFAYHSGISITLGEVVRTVAGMPVTEFAERHLFGPLGIKDYHWGKLPTGATHTGGGLWLRPRDMAKMGFLYLNGGRWKDKQIVSEDWVRESTKQQVPYFGYGYQWWLRTFRLRDHLTSGYTAQGLGGQFILVLPELKMVAVFTGWNMGALTEQPFDMLQRYMLPAADPVQTRQ